MKRIYSFTVLTLLWYLMSFVIGSRLVPFPHDVFLKIINNLGVLFQHSFYSFYRILIAIIISFLLAVPLGILIASNKKLDSYLSPIVYALYPIPKIAFLPVLMLIFGLGDFSKIGLMVFVIVFQVLVSVRDAVQRIPRSSLLLMESMQAKKSQVWIYVYLPAIVPELLSSLRISLGVVIATLFYSENYATRFGLGYYIMNAWTLMDYEALFAGIVFISVLSLILYGLIDCLQSKIQRAYTIK